MENEDKYPVHTLIEAKFEEILCDLFLSNNPSFYKKLRSKRLEIVRKTKEKRNGKRN